MEFKSFTNLVKEEVERRAGGEYNVMVNDVFKNNGVVLSGLCMMHDECNISPTIYLNNYYNDFENGALSLDAVVTDVFDIYNRCKVETRMNMEFFSDFDEIKKMLIFKLVNAEKNKEMLADVPHIKFHDLAVIFQCLVSEEMLGSATITIHNSHLELWNVSAEELYKIAMENTPRRQKYCIMNIVDMMREMNSWNEFGIDDEMLENLPTIPMYVLTNEMKTNGASCILYKDLLKDLSEAFGCNLILMPSSIHEIIIIPDKDDNDFVSLKRMVMDINEEQVLPEEVLSDSVYYYDRDLDSIKVF